MATYALTYATRAAFDTALASGDIYSLMQGVTSSQPSVAIAAHITESGETFSCGTNVMVDIKSVGPGDYVMYDTTNKKWFGIASKWIDNNYPNQPTQHILIFKAGVLPARFVVCGTVIKRFGNRIRLAGTGVELPWTSTDQNDNAWPSTLPFYMEIIKKAGTTTTPVNSTARISFPSIRYQESQYPSGNTTEMPITRSTWNAALSSGQSSVTQNGKTVVLSDYKYSFDIYSELNFAPKWPASSGAYSDLDGMANTVEIANDFLGKTDKNGNLITLQSETYAIGYCYNYSINAPGLGKHSWFLGTIKDVGEICALRHTLITTLAWRSGYLWSSTRYSEGAAWYVYPYGYTYSGVNYRSYYAVPLADLILEN